MADPLSVAAGVVGITAVALHSVRSLKEFIDNIHDAPRAITNLGTESVALRTVLEDLHHLLEINVLNKKAAQAELVPNIQIPLDGCTTTVKDIERKILPFTKEVNKSKRYRWRNLIAWRFREKEFIALQNTLLAQKTTLMIAISTSNVSALPTCPISTA